MIVLILTKIVLVPVLFVYFKIKTINKQFRKIKGKAIIISNHKSFWDALLITYYYWTETIHFLVSKSVFDRKNFGSWYMRQIGGIETPLVNSGLNPISGAVSVLQKDRKVVIFPEGRINKIDNFLPFKSGAVLAALKTGAPIIPLYIGGKYGLFKRVKVVLGKPIYIDAILGDKSGKQAVLEGTKYLEDVMNNLKKQAN